MGTAGSYRTTHAPRRRRFAAALLVSAILVAAAPQSAQAAASPKERRFASMVNATRGAATLSSMKLSNHLSDVARKHSKHMANKGELYHSNLERLLGPGVTAVGENVGFGGSLDDLLKAFLASPPHAENLLGDYRQTGVGIVRADGQIWITQVFAS
jgi:uncharacterized protein YkwD